MVNEERGILNMAREREYAKRCKCSPVKRYFISGKELEYYRNLTPSDEEMSIGDSIVLQLLKRGNQFERRKSEELTMV